MQVYVKHLKLKRERQNHLKSSTVIIKTTSVHHKHIVKMIKKACQGVKIIRGNRQHKSRKVSIKDMKISQIQVDK